MPFRVIKHRTRKVNKGNRLRHSSRRRGGGPRSHHASPVRSRSPSPARARSRSRSPARSPARSPEYPIPVCDMIPPDEIGLFSDARPAYGYTMDGRGDGKIGLVSFHTACVVGYLRDEYQQDPDYVETLESGDHPFIRAEWIFDAVNLRASKKQKNNIKSWRKRVNKHQRNIGAA